MVILSVWGDVALLARKYMYVCRSACALNLCTYTHTVILFGWGKMAHLDTIIYIYSCMYVCTYTCIIVCLVMYGVCVYIYIYIYILGIGKLHMHIICAYAHIHIYTHIHSINA